MKRLLTCRTEIAILSWSTAALAASRRSVAVEMRGGNVNVWRVEHGDVMFTLSSNGHGLGCVLYRRRSDMLRRFNLRVTRKVGLEHRIDACVHDRGNRGCRLGGLEGGEMRVESWIAVRLGNLSNFVDVRLRREMNADETIALRGLG